MLLQLKVLIQIIVNFRTENIFYMFLWSTIHSLFIVQQILCSITLKSNELKFYVSLKENKLACFTNSKCSFQVHSDFWNNYYEINISSPWWCTHAPNKAHKNLCTRISNFFIPWKLPPWLLSIFIDMNTFKGISKHSWKKIVQLL